MPIKYSSRNLHVRAKQAESKGEPDEAAKLYFQALKNSPTDDLAYNRLMVYYRKKKQYKKEMQIIQSAIASHQQHVTDYQEQWIKRNKKTARTARALVKSLGQVNRKGMTVLESKQIDTWRKRLAVVRKRMANNKA